MFDARGGEAGDVTRLRAEQELEQRRRELVFLRRAAHALLESRDANHLPDSLFSEAAGLLQLDVYCHHILEAAAPACLRLAAFAGLPDSAARALDGTAAWDGMSGSAVRTRRVYVCETQHWQQRDAQVLHDHGVRVYVCHPLVARDEVLGTLSFGSTQRDRFTREELNLLRAVADQFALAVDRAQADEREAASRRRAEQACRAKDQFLALIGHELRTPLTAVLGYADLLRSDVAGTQTAEQRRYTDRILDSAWSLAATIDEMLLLVRTHAGQEAACVADVDAAGVTRDVVQALTPDAVRKGLLLSCRLPERAQLVRTDAAKLRRILVHVVGNAIKFTDGGTVSVELDIVDGGMRFLVADTGPGIAAHDLERIFDPFVQVDVSETRTKNGAGLGLTITRELVGILGGQVLAESEPGRGSRFVVALPVAARMSDDRPVLSRGSGGGT